MPELKLINIEKTFKDNTKLEKTVFSLNNINLTLNDGEFLSVLGPSGSGKTTLLKIMSGLLKPDNGIILEDGKNIMSVPVEKRNYAMVSQQPLLFPNLNIMENICFGLKMRRIKKTERVAAAKNMIDKLKINGLEKRYPSQISGGQAQRVSIARALVVEPKILFMDEPFSALNEELRYEMRLMIKEIHKKNNMTIVFVTHDKEEANFLSDRIITIKNGTLE